MAASTFVNPPCVRGLVPIDTFFGLQCHQCLNLRRQEDGPQPLSCSCGQRYYCKEECRINDARTHESYCFDRATFTQIAEKAHRDRIAFAYDDLYNTELIAHAVNHILARWVLESRYPVRTRLFPTDAFQPNNWKDMFRRGVYYHFQFEIRHGLLYKWLTLVAKTIRPMAELPAHQLEEIYMLCDSMHPAIVFGFTVVDGPFQGSNSLPYVTTRVHPVPIEIASSALDNARAFVDNL